MRYNMKQEAMAKNVTENQEQRLVRMSGQKAAGTRYGVLIDWRSGATTSGTPFGRYGRSLRDGR